MQAKLFINLIIVTLFVLVSTSCGSTKVSTQNNTHASVGQQLLDLQKARDQGLIDEKEYNRLRDAIVKKNK